MKLKRLSVFIFLAAVTACLAIAGAGCNKKSAHAHTLEKIAENPATCLTNGNIEYWSCAGCGKYFKDEKAETEISLAKTVLTALGHKAGASATCTTMQTCTTCGEVLSPATGHINLTAVAAVSATCTEDGNIAYLQCADCGKYFTDESCKNEITVEQTAVKASGHTPVSANNAVAATCTTAGKESDEICSTCKTTLTLGAETTAIGHRFSETTYIWADDNSTCTATRICQNNQTHTETETATAQQTTTAQPTCTQKGKVEYVATFTNGEFATQKKTLEIPATGHLSAEYVAANVATCIVAGNIGYWRCPACGGYFADENCENEITETQTVTAATGHKFTREIAEEKYIKATASCISPAVYYKTCATCGEISKEDTFTYGEKDNARHSYKDGICTLCQKNIGEEVEFTLNANGTAYEVKARNTSITAATIPATYNDLPVTCIATGAFKGCARLKTITIEGGVEECAEGAFEGCKTLESVYYGGDIEDWCNITFSGYEANPMYHAAEFYLIDSGIWRSVSAIIIPQTVKKIGDYQFCGFNALTSVTAEGAKIIGEYAFSGCTALSSIILGEELTEIKTYAFSSCVSLITITLPKSLTCIGNYAFSGCFRLVEIYNLSPLTITAGDDGNGRVALYAKAVHTALSEASHLTKTDGGLAFYIGLNGAYLVGYFGESAKITLPENVGGKSYEINQHAFYGCTQLIEVKLCGDVTELGESAFDGCVNLTSVTLPNGLKTIGANAFSGCCSLAEISLPKSLESIGDGAFFGCSALTKITLPTALTTIGKNTFKNCFALTSVTFEKTDGWHYMKKTTELLGTELYPEDLADPAAAATLIATTYCAYYWQRS